MKNTTLTTLAGMLLCSIVNAGEPMKGSPTSSAAAAAPMMTNSDWFIGATAGSMNDLDEFYTFQVGKDLSTNLAAYLEVGSFTEEAGSDELDVVPITLNAKYEAPLAGALNWYATGGLGIASWDLSSPDGDADGTSFYAQATAGLLYNINQTFEVFGGARWIYLDEASSDDWGWEGGLRINF